MPQSLDAYVEDFRLGPAFADDQPVFLNSAGSSLPDPRVVARMTNYLLRESTVGGNEAANDAEVELARFYDRAGQLIGATGAEIAFVDSGTRGWNGIVYSTLGLEPGDEIITASSEFGSNLVSLVDVAQRHGAAIRLVDLDSRGAIDRDHLPRCFRREPVWWH